MLNCNQSLAPSPFYCPSQSVGLANQLFSTLFQTLLTAQCAIAPPEMWPDDYAEIAIKESERGDKVTILYLLIKLNFLREIGIRFYSNWSWISWSNGSKSIE